MKYQYFKAKQGQSPIFIFDYAAEKLKIQIYLKDSVSLEKTHVFHKMTIIEM